MPSQFNSLPNYPVRLALNGETSRDWYFFWAGLFRGLPPGNVEEVTLDASPATYSATKRGTFVISGGTVSQVEFSRDGTNFYDIGVTAGPMTLNAADQLRITYTGAPDTVFIPS